MEQCRLATAQWHRGASPLAAPEVPFFRLWNDSCGTPFHKVSHPLVSPLFVLIGCRQWNGGGAFGFDGFNPRLSPPLA